MFRDIKSRSIKQKSLDLTISAITLLMPSNLPLNTESTAGYKNSLKKAAANMKLEVNKSAHLELKSVGVRYMNGGPSKINGPTSHPSNTINKEELTSLPYLFGYKPSDFHTNSR